MTPEERAHETCVDHLRRYPLMANVPIQSVYEWLVQVQREALAEEREACARLAESRIETPGADTGAIWRSSAARSIAVAIRARTATP